MAKDGAAQIFAAFDTWWIEWAAGHPNASKDRGTSLRAAFRAGELYRQDEIAKLLTPLFQRLVMEGKMTINEARAILKDADTGIVKR